MEPAQFVRALQIIDSFFPVGAFAYSDGLETAASVGAVHDGATLGLWMAQFIDDVLVPCEGLALVKCMRAAKADDAATLRLIDEELTAIRPAKASRAASSGIGRSLISLYTSICGDPQLASLARMLPQGNVAAAYAIVFQHCGMPEREAILAFGYNRLAGIVSSGLRLIRIGHLQGQSLLTGALARLPDAAERILAMADEPVRSFTPLLDIYQMNHRYVYSRLFRS
jgi:urease accessory protein